MLVVDQQLRIANNVDEQDVTDLEFEGWLTFGSIPIAPTAISEW